MLDDIQRLLDSDDPGDVRLGHLLQRIQHAQPGTLHASTDRRVRDTLTMKQALAEMLAGIAGDTRKGDAA